MREGEAELDRLVRRVHVEARRAGVAGEAMDLPHIPYVPSELKRAILQNLQMLWIITSGRLAEAKRRTLELVRGGTPVPTAALMAGRALNLRPRQAGPGRTGPTTQQIRQYGGRQEQRGRRPGQDPRTRRR